MSGSLYDLRHRPRELRRRVVLPARLRQGGSWSDACILNVSSRGLMIQSIRPSRPGSIVELYRGAYVIEARVVWQEGRRSGLQVDDALPVDEMLTLCQAPRIELTADARLVERRLSGRGAEASRWRGRAMQFAGVGAIAVALCVATMVMFEEAFARPMAAVEQAFAN